MEMIFEWLQCPPEKLLVEQFRISGGFHNDQRTIIEQLVQGRRVLAIQRTGWGKSLCYQMASLYYPHLTIVFSPLKALMRDQCERCNTTYGIPAAIVSSEFDQGENEVTLERAASGKLKLLFIAPERLSNALWQKYIPRLLISMIVIDEAHCISTWGHDFRPDYRRIVTLLNAMPRQTPVLALTATANRRVEQDILQQMGAGVVVVRGTMRRPNLYLNVVYVQGEEEKLAYLGETLPHAAGSGIVYTATKRDAETVATFLQHLGLVAEYYHAGRDEPVRLSIEQGFMQDQYKVVCSTNALGMGIDKSNIRFVIHYQMPASPIHYYQEMGRAGRDGKVSWCILLYDPVDIAIQEYFIRAAKPESSQYERVLSLLKMLPDGLGEQNIMRRTGFSRTVIRNILADLTDQNFVERNAAKRYVATGRPGFPTFAEYDVVREQKLHELHVIQEYAAYDGCLMEYLTTFLGDQPGYCCGGCGHCRPEHFPSVVISKRMQEQVIYFQDGYLLPHIEKRGEKSPVHEEGWALSYYGIGSIGKLVRACKYDQAGPFPLELVERAVEVIRERYPIRAIDVIVSVPPTKSGRLVEDFAQRVADLLSLPYISAVVKVRSTLEQKDCTNWIQKMDNVKDAFAVRPPSVVAGPTVLLIDDIYDSGQTLREIGTMLMQAGARAVYPFVIVRTKHSDDQ
jgi:ATP-dependent DNA helicase RecQ